MIDSLTSKFKHPVLFFNNAIGDHLINLPSIRALNHLFRNELTIILEHGFYDLFYQELEVFKLVEIDVDYFDDYPHPCFEQAKVSIAKCDLYLCLNPWKSSFNHDFIQHYSPELSVGFSNDFQVELPLNFEIHSSLLGFSLVNYFCPLLRIEHFSSPPRLCPSSLNQAKNYLKKNGVIDKFVVVHLDTENRKMCTLDFFIESILLQNKVNIKSSQIVVVGLDDMGFCAKWNSPKTISAVGMDIATSVAIVSLSNYFIGVDSCMLHVADAFKIPGIGFFGPTNFKEFGFRQSASSYVFFNTKL